MFNLMRHYAITSLACMVVAAVLLTALYRHVKMQENVELVPRSDLTLAEKVVHAVGPELGDYLQSVSKHGPQEASRTRMPTPLASALASSASEAPVAGIRIYNDQGVVVFSTDAAQIGAIGAGEPGFISAINGKAVSDLVYQDASGSFGERAPGDGLVITYVPVRHSRTGPVSGVLAIHTDLSPLVSQSGHDARAAAAGIASILLLLYCVLFLTVQRAHKIIDAQQATIRARTQTLEALSAEMLKNEEIEKTKLAAGLQEDLAQTLSAIKMRIESTAPSGGDAFAAAPLAPAVSALQGVVDELQHTAMELRPSSLDELGLLPTVRWYCRELECSHLGFRIDPQISVAEEDIPDSLKTAMYRIIETALKDIAGNSNANRIQLNLGQTATAITLAIDAVPGGAAAHTPVAADPRMRFLVAQERTTLTGGTFSLRNNDSGGVTLRMRWNTVQEPVCGRDDGQEYVDLERRGLRPADCAPSLITARVRRGAA